MLASSYPYYLAGRPVAANQDGLVTNKYSGEIATRVAKADRAVVEQAVAAADEAAGAMRRLPAYRRQEVLAHLGRRVQERHEELAEALCIEAGKPIRDARGEITRAVDTFRIAAEEATRMYGEYLPLEISPRAAGCEAIVRPFPIGPCSFICPFNFPINLAAHKIAPALAVGCPFVLKPASWTPVGALLLGEILAECDLPEGAFSILPCSARDATPMTHDDRIKLLSFTGSAEVGWKLKAEAGKKKVSLELGGNAACIVDEGADVQRCAERIIFGAYYQSGQSCISVQRILAHESLCDELAARIAELAGDLKKGDPLDEATFLGPMISEDDAKRVESWVNEAVEAGARVLCGGKRDGVFYEVTLLADVDHSAKVSCEEVFGPVATIEPFSSFEDACRLVNDSDFGLQAGVFTTNIHRAFHAFDELEVGGVVINDIPSLRVDSMPYGGVKDSGLGREGIRWAMEEMSEPKLMLLKDVGR
ncbi:MAG: aldehyde dehydrogenase family protein [Planctomycetota bacterium]|nr:aldehyde dehydrogenase family protein [Planctomycetota bacterium]